MPEELERPEGVAGPPVRLVAVEDHGRVVGNSRLRAHRGEFLGVDVVANELVLEVALPVDPDGAGNVAQVVEQEILVALDDADLGVLQVVCDPVGRDEDFRMSVRFSHGVDSVDKSGWDQASLVATAWRSVFSDRLDRDPIVNVGEEALDDQPDGGLLGNRRGPGRRRSSPRRRGRPSRRGCSARRWPRSPARGSSRRGPIPRARGCRSSDRRRCAGRLSRPGSSPSRRSATCP